MASWMLHEGSWSELVVEVSDRRRCRLGGVDAKRCRAQPGRFWTRPAPRQSGRFSGLHPPGAVLALGASIDGLLW
jgi:hypothetical protein